MRTITYLQAVREAMEEEMERDEKVFVIGLDVGTGLTFGVTTGMIDKFGKERVIDTPIAELSVAGVATGAALNGLRPVMEVMLQDFITLCMEQITNQAAKARLMTGGQLKAPVVFRAPGGWFGSFAAQHSQSLEAWFAHIPGLKVIAPSTPAEAKALLKAAIRDDNPVAFFEHKKLFGRTGEVGEYGEDYVIEIGKADIKREGTDVSIITYSNMIWEAMDAAEELAKEGISCEVLDLRTISPMDREAICETVKKTGRVVVAEEGVETGGIGAEVTAVIADEVYEYLDAPVKRVACPMIPIPFNPDLERFVVPNKDNIIDAVREVING